MSEEVKDIVPEEIPVIPNCVQYKYYHVPEHMKRLRTKRKVAIVFGYVGERYCGLQWNHRPEFPTIEEALLKALYETDMISLTNIAQRNVQQLLNFERASRTDKGVHALRNVISMNVMLPYSDVYVEKFLRELNNNDKVVADESENIDRKKPNDNEDADIMFSCEKAKALLNEALPQDIHVYDLIPVTKSFNSYLNCEGRRYEYYLPTFALMNSEEYQKKFFPPSLAPLHPTQEDVGFMEGGLAAITRIAEPKKSGDGEHKKKKEKSTNQKKSHFPRSKRRRMEDELAAKKKEEAEASKGVEQNETEQAEKNEASEEENEGQEKEQEGKPQGETMFLFRTIAEDAMKRAAEYRIEEKQLNYIRELFHLYEGTHSFHNFTPGGGGSNTASCHRYMKSITVSDPYVVEPDDPCLLETIKYWSPSRFFAPDEVLTDKLAKRKASNAEDGKSEGENVQSGYTSAASVAATFTKEEEEEFRENMRQKIQRIYSKGIEVVRIELHGQSFMLNQIRKMIGAVIALSASGLPSTYLTETLMGKGIRRGIPMAPANGLFLSYLDFSGYNRRLNRIQQEGHNGANKGVLDVEKVDAVELEEMRRFIVDVILRNEMVEDMMGKWMRSLRHVTLLSWQKEIP